MLVLNTENNIDLKELERFGFKHLNEIHYYADTLEIDFYQLKIDCCLCINIFAKDSVLGSNIKVKKNVFYLMDTICGLIECGNILEVPDVIYELIKADIIKKSELSSSSQKN